MLSYEEGSYFAKHFLEWINSEEFSQFISYLADDIKIKISKNYHSVEPNIVKEIIDSFQVKSSLMSKLFRVKTFSAFIHGGMSKVSFSFDNDKLRRELGDMLFITTLRINRNFKLTKLSIIQVKKTDRINRRIDINQGQLYLLSKFPKFSGVSGLFIGEFKFSNLSKNLGGYIIFNNIGDLIYTSAVLLRRILYVSNSINYQKLHHELCDYSLLQTKFCIWKEPECFMTCLNKNNEKLIPVSVRNNLYSLCIYDFLKNLFSFSIGEIVQYRELRFLKYLSERMKVYSKSPKNKELQLFLQGTQEFFLNVNKTLSSYDDGNKNDNREELVDDSDSGMGVVYIEISYEY